MKKNNLLKLSFAIFSLAICLFMFNSCNSSKAKDAVSDATKKASAATQEVVNKTATATKEAAKTVANEVKQAVVPDDGKDAFAEISTDYGKMKVKLYKECPKHKANFIKLANEGFYNDLLFHRIIKGFMIQGGDPKSKGAAPTQRLGSGGPGYKVDAEIGKAHIKGALCAARQGGAINPEKKSSGSQFYIVQGKPQQQAQLEGMAKAKKITYSPEDIAAYVKNGGTPQLDNDYTVFGQVIEGMDVIDKIAAVQTAPGDRPVKDVKMQVKMLDK